MASAGQSSKTQRRKHGTGSCRFKNGAFEIALPRAGGAKQTFVRLPGYTRPRAEAELDLMIAEINAGRRHASPDPAPVQRMTFEELWIGYRDHLSREASLGELGQTRLDDFSSMMRAHILPALGRAALEDFDTELIQTYRRGKLAGSAPCAPGAAKAVLAFRTINHHVGLIGSVFRWGMHRDREFARFDPTADIKPLTD
jgi:hypothetical protein